MRLHVLGCAGAEMPSMNLPAFLIDRTLLLDAGTIGLALNLSEQKLIRDIFITHPHLDHIKAVPFFADNIANRDPGQKVRLYSDHKVLQVLRRHLFNNLIWPDFSTIPMPEMAVIEYHGVGLMKPTRLARHTVTAFRVNHPTPAVGYLVEDDEGVRLLYTGDTGPSEEIWKACDRRIHALIAEISFPNSMESKALLTGHMTPLLLGREFDKMKTVPDHVMVTHAKPAFTEQIAAEVAALGHANIEMLEDGRIIYLENKREG